MRNFCIAPHTLSLVQKFAGGESATESKNINLSVKHRCWHYILKRAKSWFYFTFSHDYIWFPEETVIPMRPTETVSTQTRTSTVF
jgi:hypothetical protein